MIKIKQTNIIPFNSIIKKHKEFIGYNFIKIDTDWFDTKIIKSALASITKNKPILFFEYDPYFLLLQQEVWLDIFPILSNIGYKKIMIYDNLWEYMLSCDASNQVMLESLHEYIKGKEWSKYYDVCIFHENDDTIFDMVEKSERSFFRNNKK